MDEKSRKKAFELHEEGDASALFEFIQPFLEKDDPYAHYFYSRFSLREWNESHEEFERRSLKHLQIAADRGVREAKFALGCDHMFGDFYAEVNQEKGARLIKEAAEMGHSEAMFCYGKDLLYGSFGFQKNVLQGLEYIQRALEAGVEGVKEYLEFIGKLPEDQE
jgi:TPR repeat protein